MLKITIPETELFDEATNKFLVSGSAVVLELEHSLVSLSKWEAKFQKPFLVAGEKTREEILGYVEAMILTPNYPPDVLLRLTKENLDQIQRHIDSKETATTFREMPQTKGRTEIVTSELIYYWLASNRIPIECETWHLNRLFTLIRIFVAKSSKPKRMSKSAIAQQYRELNAARKARLGTSG